MGWESVAIDYDHLMDVKGNIISVIGISSIVRDQMFDIDIHGFPVFTDKNMVLLNMLFDNDAAYAKVLETTYEDEMSSIFKGMFITDSGETQRTNIRRAVYRVNRDNSTSLPTLSNAKQNNASGKPTQKQIVDLLRISNGERVDGKALNDKTGSEEDKKRLTGGSLLTAHAIIEMIQSGVDSNGDFKSALLSGEADLVYKIAHAAEKKVNESLGSDAAQLNFPDIYGKEIDKNNFSFATKFCHHACRRMNGGAGKFCIYDSVVHEFLPYYACEYLDPDVLNTICDFDTKFDTFEDEYEEVNNRIEDWRKYTPKGSLKKEGYGYERYRNLYDAVLEAINQWKDTWRRCPANSSSVIRCFPSDSQCEKLDYCNFDRFVWYFFKNQRRKESAKKSLRKWGNLSL